MSTEEQKVDAYKLVVGRTLVQLQDNVNGWIRRGWRPIGGPVIHDESLHGAVAVQAMVVDNVWRDL